MQEKVMDFEAINAHLDSNYVEAKNVQSLTTASAQSQLCGVYKTVRPILVALSNLVIIPNKWRAALATFISVMDVICP